MKLDNFFRTLVIVNWLLQFLLHILPIASWYNDPLLDKLIALDGYGAMLQLNHSFLYQSPLWGFLVASVGMLLFLNWGRYAYLALWAYGWIATLLFGVRVSLPIEGFIGMIIGTIDGVILYLVFFSTLRFKFKKVDSLPTSDK